jgi:hypothetical protein
VLTIQRSIGVWLLTMFLVSAVIGLSRDIDLSSMPMPYTRQWYGQFGFAAGLCIFAAWCILGRW